MYVSHNVEESPSCLTHLLELESGRIVKQSEFKNRVPRSVRRASSLPPLPVPADPGRNVESNDGSLVQVENVNVSLSGKRILAGINWSLRQGQNWAILGRNGSGKTTFLKLLAGELLPVWGGTIRRFGNNGIRTLWDIRRRISFVSGDLQASFQCPQTCLELAVSGFFGSVGLYDEPTSHQIDEARSWMDTFGLGGWANLDVRSLSYGRLRMMLIIRAMVTRPSVLLLDEPVAGLDSRAKVSVLAMIDKLATQGTSLVYVTHHEGELVSSVTHVALMGNGRLTFQGTREEFHDWEHLKSRS
jgi:molybdate transport system ATP-binding protein